MKTAILPTLIRRMSCVALVAACVFLPLQGRMHGADVRFKTYQDDKSRFERSIDQAKDAAELEAWERVVEGGRDELRAAWERDADFKIAAALREEGDTPERRAALEQDRQEARAAWERDITAATDEAAGSWYARRQGITYERFDVERFFEALRDTEAIDRTQALADQVRDWDAIINPVAEEIRARWEESEEAFLNALRARANDLDDARRDAYGREVARIEQEIERMFRLERNSYIYRERNKFISDLLIDQQSLKRKSADEAAGSASERIINETLKDLEKEEERIRTGEMKTPEGAGAVDFSKLGENWKEEIDRLLDAGLERWKRAQEELMNAMRNWKANAEDAYAAGDRMWREAYERLLGAQDQWRTKIDREIQEGLADWQEQQLDLRDNIDLSRDNLLAYLQSQQEQWNENSRGLREMALYGREAYRDARENELFLKDMYDRYLNSGYYEVAGYSRQCFPSDPCNNTPWGSVSIPIGNRYGSNRLWYNVWFSQNDYDPATRTVVEHYRYSWYWNDDGGPDPWWKWHYWEYEWTNSINSSTPLEKRSRFYFYATTYDDWRSTASEYANIIATAEDYIHNRNMLGQSGGPGYLVNSDGTYGLKYLMDGANIRGLENDQYLMTSAEFGYEYARRELDFRQKRLDIAEAIMQYAYPEEYSSNPYTDILGRRESAETTVSRRDAAQAAMATAKTAYEDAYDGLDAIIVELNGYKDIIAQRVTALRAKEDDLNAKKQAYEDMRLMYVLEANEDFSAEATVSKETLDALQTASAAYYAVQQEYNALRAELEQARTDYNTRSGDYTAQMNTIADLYKTYQEREFEYEKAYAVWEYANTPYLKGSQNYDAGLTTGSVPGSGTGDFAGMTSPDARENYEHHLTQYNTAHDVWAQAKDRMDNQETVEMLYAMDGTYAGLRDAAATAVRGYADGGSDPTAAVNEYLNYCAGAAMLGLHDQTVLLRDQEGLFYELLQYSKDRDSDAAYNYTINALVSNGSGTSVGDRIVSGMLEQNRLFQEQNWDQRQATMDERERRWQEVVGFIKNRGERDWTNNLLSFENAWAKWREEMRAEITKGEEKWTGVFNEFNGRMANWQVKMAEAASDAGSKRMVEDLMADMQRYIDGLNRNLPGSARLDFDAQGLVTRLTQKIPEGIGVLADSMRFVDTTAGFTNIFSLGLNYTDAFSSFEKKMKSFQEGMEKMRAVRQGEAAYQVFLAMIDEFNRQLAEMNTNNYGRVESEIRSQYKAPFRRGWKLSVTTGKTMMGGREKDEISFSDYRSYVNTTVFLKPLKGIEGNVDFRNPYTYQNLNERELGLFVKLETDFLNREIDRVFRPGGYFESHTTREFGRLHRDFADAYSKYQGGKSFEKMNGFDAPIVAGAPSMRMVTQISASIAANILLPGSGAAVTAAFTAYDVSQGKLSATQAITETGIGFVAGAAGPMGGMFVNTLAQGFKYGKSGGLSFDLNNISQDAWKTAVANAAVSGAIGNGIASKFVMNSMDVSGSGFLDFKLNMDNWQDNLAKAGIAELSNAAGGLVKDPFASKAVSGFTSNLLSTVYDSAAHGTSLGDAYANNFNWNSMVMNHKDVGNMVGSMVYKEVQNAGKSPADKAREAAQADNAKEGFWGGLWTSLRNGFTKDGGGIIEAIKEGAKYTGDYTMASMNDMVNSVASLPSKIANLPTAAANTLASVANTITNLPNTIVNLPTILSDTVSKYGSAIASVFGGMANQVGKGVERVGNLVKYGEFATSDDPDVLIAKAKSEGKLLQGQDADVFNSVVDKYGPSATGLGNYMKNRLSVQVDANGDFVIVDNQAAALGERNKQETSPTRKMSYEDAQRLMDKDGGLDIDKYVKYTSEAQNEAINSVKLYSMYADDLGLKGGKKYAFVIDAMRNDYKNTPFLNQDHLNYTYAGIMEGLGHEFDDKIKYQRGEIHISNENWPKIGASDCTSYAVAGMHILGLNDSLYTGKPVNPQYQPGTPPDFVFEKTPETKANPLSSANLAANKTVVERYDARSSLIVDKTGMIGITSRYNDENYLDHTYVSLNTNASEMTHCSDPYGVSGRQKNSYIGWKTRYFLQLKLRDDRKIQ